MPLGYEIDEGVDNTDFYTIRKKSRFQWGEDEQEQITKLTQYHRCIRKNIIPIFGSPNTWYLKKNIDLGQIIKRPQLPLIFASMHRLSELSRYDPINLSLHFEADHNWLLTEFLQVAPTQFIRNK